MKTNAVFVALTVSAIAALGCEEKPKLPGEVDFDQANRLISSNKGGAVAHGNTEQAKAMALEFSKTMEKAQRTFFTGGKKNRVISLTDDAFLTYCRANDDGVLFMVHVPQFKRYKGEVRESLLQLAWMAALEATEARYGTKDVQLAIGLRGAAMYGASAIGSRSGKPRTEEAWVISDDRFYGYFLKKDEAQPVVSR